MPQGAFVRGQRGRSAPVGAHRAAQVEGEVAPRTGALEAVDQELGLAGERARGGPHAGEGRPGGVAAADRGGRRAVVGGGEVAVDPVILGALVAVTAATRRGALCRPGVGGLGAGWRTRRCVGPGLCARPAADGEQRRAGGERPDQRAGVHRRDLTGACGGAPRWARPPRAQGGELGLAGQLRVGSTCSMGARLFTGRAYDLLPVRRIGALAGLWGRAARRRASRCAAQTRRAR